MDRRFDFASAPSDVTPLPADFEVPIYPDILPDGRVTIIYGDPERLAFYNHRQGDNPCGVRGDCGLVACQDVLNQFGIDVTEADVVRYAIENELCDTSSLNPSERGGTTLSDQYLLLTDFGIPVHTESDNSLQDLATHIESGQATIIHVNAETIWGMPVRIEEFRANHAITVTGVARDPVTHDVQGFYVNDSGDGQGNKFLDAPTLRAGWVEVGGVCIVTDTPSPALVR